MADSKKSRHSNSPVRTVVISLVLITAAILIGLFVAGLIKDKNAPAAALTPIAEASGSDAVQDEAGYNTGKTSMMSYAKDIFIQFWNDTFHKDDTASGNVPTADMPLNRDRDYGLADSSLSSSGDSSNSGNSSDLGSPSSSGSSSNSGNSSGSVNSSDSGSSSNSDSSAGSEASSSASAPEDEGFSQIVSLSPMNLIYDYDPETGHIYNMLLEVLLCSTNELHYIYIPTDVTYIMSASAYRKLSNSNITVPKIITYSHLYDYYGNDKAFDAGRQILADQLGYPIPFYTAVDHKSFENYIKISTDGDTHSMRMLIPADVARSDSYGTPGSYSGIIVKGLEGAVTNWSAAAHLRYLDTYDSMTSDSWHFLDTSVTKKNETNELNVLPIMKYLEKILY